MVWLEAVSNVLRTRAQYLIHCARQCRVESRICREQVSVRAQHGIYAVHLEITAEYVDGIGAEQPDVAEPEEPVPHLLEPRRAGDIARIPEQPDHLSVGTHTSLPGVRTDMSERFADYGIKQGSIRHTVDHESSERHGRIEKDQSAFKHGLGIPGGAAEVADKAAPVLGRADDEQSVATLEALLEIAADVAGQQAVVPPIELDHMLFGREMIQEFGTGGH